MAPKPNPIRDLERARTLAASLNQRGGRGQGSTMPLGTEILAFPRGLAGNGGGCRTGRTVDLAFGKAPQYSFAPPKAPVAQLDRAPDYESGGQRFESFRARQFSLVSIANLGKLSASSSGKAAREAPCNDPACRNALTKSERPFERSVATAYRRGAPTSHPQFWRHAVPPQPQRFSFFNVSLRHARPPCQSCNPRLR
jgi:hypothetical protein